MSKDNTSAAPITPTTPTAETIINKIRDNTEYTLDFDDLGRFTEEEIKTILAMYYQNLDAARRMYQTLLDPDQK